MNKEELITRVNEIPKFVLRDVATKDSCVNEPDGNGNPTGISTWWNEQPGDKAVTEENSTRAIAYMSKRYKIVQFKDMFLPIVDQFDVVDGDMKYDTGFAIMDIFPAHDEYHTEDGTKIGITAYNSVDRTSALNIKFCVMHGKRILTIPKKLAGFRKMHVGNVGQITQNYINMLGTIKGTWKTIVTQFGSHQVTLDEFDDLVKQFDLDDRAAKKMKLKVASGQTPNLWTFVMECFDMIEARHFKSDVHKRKRLDDLCNVIFTYNMVMQLSAPIPPGPQQL